MMLEAIIIDAAAMLCTHAVEFCLILEIYFGRVIYH